MADELAIEDFVLNKGALSVLFELGVEDQSFNDLKESPTVLISPNTLSKRLKEAQRLDLVDKVVGEGEVRSTINYQLTEHGEALLSQFDDIHNQYFDLKKEIAELKEEMNEKERTIRKILSEQAGKKLEEDALPEESETDEGAPAAEDGPAEEDEGAEDADEEGPAAGEERPDEPAPEPAEATDETGGSGDREDEIQKLADELDLE